MHKEKYENFVAGWGAGFVETVVLYPQNKIIFRQQLQGVPIKEVYAQLRNEGWRMLYRGILPPLVQRTTTRSVMFGMFDKFYRYFNCCECQAPLKNGLCIACAAFMAGAVEAITCPLERTQVLLQSPRFNHKYQNTGHALTELAKIGSKELYRGFSLVLLRNGLSNVLFFSFRKPLRDLVINFDRKCISEDLNSRISDNLLAFMSDFISGALLGASISTLFFPLNVVKQRMQSTVNTPFLTAWSVLQVIWIERNGSFRQLFRGITLNYTRYHV
ncbi:unnamed protein product [Thelazia callipaeda]|uniref:Mitochondrial carrier protein n=1 Tax=Thelazia callipaeda TaxID=103827 RepID=A0A0N5CUC1_THECL|nr:unnamed protein product [Thelazia callipaeda]